MREHKYRAWNKIEKVMEHPMTVKDMIAMVPGPDLNLDDYEIVEFTGLLDKNGVEIYEGDIVESVHLDIGKYNSQIEFQSGCFMFFPIDAKGISWGALNRIYLSCEVVGNIYEHSELIRR